MEICICAAIKFKNVEEDQELIIRGQRHCDCFYNKHNRPDKDFWKECEEGFLTSKNRFVGRVEGRNLMEAVNWESVDREGYRGNSLYSEDLY